MKTARYRSCYPRAVPGEARDWTLTLGRSPSALIRSNPSLPAGLFAKRWKSCTQQHIPTRKGASMTSLRQRMIEDMQVRNLSVNTQHCYIQQVSLFARHFNRPPELLGPEQIRIYSVRNGRLSPNRGSSMTSAMACAKCSFYLPKDSTKVLILEAKTNLLRLRQDIPFGRGGTVGCRRWANRVRKATRKAGRRTDTRRTDSPATRPRAARAIAGG
jgi:hypothetical protein